MRKAFVIDGTDNGEIVGALCGEWEQIRDFQGRLAVLLELALGAQDDGLSEFAVLKILVAETGRRMLPMQFREQRLGIESIDLAGAALHEQRDDAFGSGRESGASGGLKQIERGEPSDAQAGFLQEFAPRIN